jgi:hypothetical protein
MGIKKGNNIGQTPVKKRETLLSLIAKRMMRPFSFAVGNPRKKDPLNYLRGMSHLKAMIFCGRTLMGLNFQS